MKIQLADFALPLLQDHYRYKVLYGGRGSAKSYSIADVLLIRGYISKRRILCGREFQNSISESVHQLLKERAHELKLDTFYNFTNTSIAGKNGTEFFFKGVRHNIQSIKSMQGVTDLWLEEAQTVSQISWETLIPTIRTPGSEIFVSFNPDSETDPTYQKFLGKEGPPPSTYIRKVNWNDNPWFPDVLKAEKDHMYATNPDLAEHIWGGACRSHSDAQVFKGKYKIDLFEIRDSWDGPYFGSDWGFSTDPLTLVKIYIDWDEKILYIRKDFHKKHIELDDIPAAFDTISESRETKIRADNSRPETISYIEKKGFIIEGAKKWTGSVEDGIEFIKSFNKVVIHPEAKATAREFKNYSYKVDRLTGDVTTDIIDDWNHCVDAIRYGLEPLISNGLSILDVL